MTLRNQYDRLHSAALFVPTTQAGFSAYSSIGRIWSGRCRDRADILCLSNLFTLCDASRTGTVDSWVRLRPTTAPLAVFFPLKCLKLDTCSHEVLLTIRNNDVRVHASELNLLHFHCVRSIGGTAMATCVSVEGSWVRVHAINPTWICRRRFGLRVTLAQIAFATSLAIVGICGNRNLDWFMAYGWASCFCYTSLQISILASSICIHI